MAPKQKHHAIHKICQNLEAFGSIGHSMAAPQHMEVPRQGGQPVATATAYSKAPPTPGPSHTAAGGTTGPSSH